MSNLRDSFPLSERMVEEIGKLTQMKPVDESSIGFKSSKRRSNEKPSLSTSLHGKLITIITWHWFCVPSSELIYILFLILEGACDECHNVLAILKCLNCNGTLFCKTCWHEVCIFSISYSFCVDEYWNLFRFLQVHRFNATQKHEYEWIASNSPHQLEKVISATIFGLYFSKLM